MSNDGRVDPGQAVDRSGCWRSPGPARFRGSSPLVEGTLPFRFGKSWTGVHTQAVSWIRDHSHGQTWVVILSIVIFGLGGISLAADGWSWRTRSRGARFPWWFKVRGDLQRVHPVLAVVLGGVFVAIALEGALTLLARALA
jgi:hypothetical protein